MYYSTKNGIVSRHSNPKTLRGHQKATEDDYNRFMANENRQKAEAIREIDSRDEAKQKAIIAEKKQKLIESGLTAEQAEIILS